MNRETRIGVALVAGLGLLVFGMLVFGSLGGVRPDLTEYPVGEILAEPDAAAHFGTTELRIVGWYAALDADCAGSNGGLDSTIAWLQRDCPLRVLLSAQPSEAVTQADLERDGLRLAAPNGQPFPPRAIPGGANLQGQQLIFTGHFADPSSERCVPDLLARCRNTFVVSTHDGLLK